MANLDFKIELDSSDIDVALAKAERVKALLLEIEAVQAKVRDGLLSPTPPPPDDWDSRKSA